MRERTLFGILMILLAMPFVFVGYYIAILPNNWTYRRGSVFVIGILLMFMGLLGIIFDEMKVRRAQARRRERAHEKMERERYASAT
jgi:hypothetical protein